MADLCGGVQDCPLGDDELFCDSVSVTCPQNCECLTYAAKCVNFNFLNAPSLFPYFITQLIHPIFFQHLGEERINIDFAWNVAKTLHNVHRLKQKQHNMFLCFPGISSFPH